MLIREGRERTATPINRDDDLRRKGNRKSVEKMRKVKISDEC